MKLRVALAFEPLAVIGLTILVELAAVVPLVLGEDMVVFKDLVSLADREVLLDSGVGADTTTSVDVSVCVDTLICSEETPSLRAVDDGLLVFREVCAEWLVISRENEGPGSVMVLPSGLVPTHMVIVVVAG